MRILTILGLALLAHGALAGAARAGDVANLEILGFTPDGGVFAFEEYGVQDGSGFPYANRFYIDTETDKFLPDTPVRARIEDESATLEQARGKVRELGESIVKQSVLDANRGFTAGFNAVTEYSADPTRMLVNPRPVFYPVDPPLEFRLEEIGRNDTERCRDFGEINGFRLLRVGTTEASQTQVIHEDKAIPASRGCPSGYRLGAIQTFSEGSLIAYAVLISVQTYGFEGPDYRWIAVTGRF